MVRDLRFDSLSLAVQSTYIGAQRLCGYGVRGRGRPINYGADVGGLFIATMLLFASLCFSFDLCVDGYIYIYISLAELKQ